MRINLRGKYILLWTVFTFACSLMYVLGRMLDEIGYIVSPSKNDLVILLLGLVLGTPVAFLTGFIKGKEAKLHFCNQGLNSGEFVLISGVSFLVYFVVLLGVFPGFFAYDAQTELYEVLDNSYTSHQPLFHVFLLGGTVKLGYMIFGSINAGIVCYLIPQMAAFSYGNAKMISTLKKLNCAKWFRVVTVVILSLFPVVEMIVLCTTKDSLFSLMILLWFIEVIETETGVKKSNIIKLIIFGTLMCLLRKNVIYVFAVYLIFCLFYRRKEMFWTSLVSIVLSLAVYFGLAFVTNATPTGKQEMLSVPIQQLARVYNSSEEFFSDTEKELLYKYIGEEWLERYRPKVSDKVKSGFNNESYSSDKAGFWRIWFIGLKKSPVGYVNACLMTNYGYWYPDARIDGYEGDTLCTFTYGESSYFAYETETPGERKSLIPAIDKYFWMLSLTRAKDEIPVVSLAFSPGFLVWIYLFCLVLMLTIRKRRKELPLILMLLIVATLLLGPISLPRYVFYLWYCLPLTIGYTVFSMKEKE